MDNLNFGLRVEELLRQRQIKPSDFYAGINLSPQMFYDWKNKRAIPNVKTAYKVAQFFGVTVEYLLTGETDNPLQPKVNELSDKLIKIREWINSNTQTF